MRDLGEEHIAVNELLHDVNKNSQFEGPTDKLQMQLGTETSNTEIKQQVRLSRGLMQGKSCLELRIFLCSSLDWDDIKEMFIVKDVLKCFAESRP